MKRIIAISGILFIVIFAGSIIKDQIIKSVITVVVSQVSGAPVHIDGFSLGVFSQSVRISGFKIYNPERFSKSILVDLPKVNVKYDLGALLKKRIHLPDVEIEIKEIGLETNKNGKLNVDELKMSKAGEKQAAKPKAKPSAQMPLQLDRLSLEMGRIVMKDYSAGDKPEIKVYDINIKKAYKNITSVQQLVAIILVEPMKAAGIQGAAVYGVAMLAGVAVLPVTAAFTLTGKDNVQRDFAVNFDQAYAKALQVLKLQGRVSREDKAQGIIEATVNSAQIEVKLARKDGNKTQVVVSARRYLLPRPEVAGGVLYAISEKLK
jgi:uncharacterized protein involved in outer membrane biogenesis